MQDDSGTQITDWQEEGRDDYLIAWVRGKLYADKEYIKQDLRGLSDKVGFDITRLEVSHPFEDSTKIVKAYTDTYSKIPGEKKDVVNNWMAKISWSQTIVDVHVKVKNQPSKSVEEKSGKKSQSLTDARNAAEEDK